VLLTVPDGRVINVNGGENRKDVRLQEGDEDFEASDEEKHAERQNPSRHEKELLCFSGHKGLSEETEGDEQDVARHQVGHQTNREAERRHEDRRDELDATDKWLQRCRDACRPQQTAEVTETLVLNTGADEHDPDQQRQAQRDSDAGGGWHLENRNDARDVAEEDEDEEAEQERGPAEAGLTEGLHHDALFDELNRGLSQVASAGRSLLGVGAGGEHEEHDPDQRSENCDQGNFIKGWEDVLPTKKFVDGREDEATFSEHVEFPFQSWESAGGRVGQFVALRPICGTSDFRAGCDNESATYFISQKRRPR
jgi:hypothetical protein